MRSAWTNPVIAVIAVIAGLLALALGGFQFTLVGHFAGTMPSGTVIGNLPDEVKTTLILRASAAVVLVAGGMMLLLRRVPGSALTALGAAVALTGFFLEPLMAGANLGDFVEAVFGFESTGATFRALTLVVAPVALVFAVIAPPAKHLKSRGTGGRYPDEQGAWIGGFPPRPSAGNSRSPFDW